MSFVSKFSPTNTYSLQYPDWCSLCDKWCSKGDACRNGTKKKMASMAVNSDEIILVNSDEIIQQEVEQEETIQENVEVKFKEQ